MDICSAMQDDTQPLTAHEYDEWGNPKDSTQFDYIKSYCPYSNIGKKWNNLNDKCGEHVTMVCDKRPHVYVSVGMHDRNVAPWENLRWVGKLRNLRGAKSGNHFCEEDDSKGIFLNISSDAGHSGPGCLDDRYNERAYELCFLEAAVNVSNRKCPWPKAPMT